MTNNEAFPSGSPGTYSVPNAALYICATMRNGPTFRLNTRHLYYWTREGLAGGYLTGVRNRHLFVTFKDLVSLRIVAAMRANGIKPREIQIAEAELRKMYGWEYPFTMVDLWTSKPDIFMKVRGIPLSVSRHWQAAMAFIEEYLQPVHGLTFDLFGSSATWEAHHGILLDPQVQYGDPCIQGTRVPTQVIWSFYQAGDSLDELAVLYGLHRSQLENAVAWEKRIQEAATNP